MFRKKSSLNKRLHALLLVCFVPLAVMIIYLMIIMNKFSERYDQVVQNITKANAYNVDFKEDLDYIMYIIVVNSERAAELVDTTQPLTMIADARKDFRDLYERANDNEARLQLEQIIKTLDSLKLNVTEIQRDAQIVGMYENNLESLDLNIRILTELTQEKIQKYIEYEATNLEELRKKVRMDVKQAIMVSIMLASLIMLGALFISRRISRSLTAGIEELRTVTRKAGRGDFAVRAKLIDQDEELAELGNGFNQMVEHIGNLVEDIRIEQRNLRATEQKLLQAQINPHFLYNTLDAIIWLAEAKQTEQVVMMVSALSDFFRNTLSKGRDYITVAEEESHIRSYLQIQQFRYQDILEYEIDIPQELHEYQILKLTLQPIVENALYHGIKNKRGMGRIFVSGRLDGADLCFCVRDNGMGMTKERLRQVRRFMNEKSENITEPSGFGLYNVVQRIKLNYGQKYGLWVESTYGEGTEFRVLIPAVKN